MNFSEAQQDLIWKYLDDDARSEVLDKFHTLAMSGDQKSVDELMSIFGKKNITQKMSPKTWQQVVKYGHFQDCRNAYNAANDMKMLLYDNALECGVESKLSATYKIIALIKLSYGGIVSMYENNDQSKNKFVILPKYNGDFNIVCLNWSPDRLVTFHTAEQAAEFLKYDENKQLLNLYYGQGFDK